MEIIRYSELKPQPWRNGGGVTRELASNPQAASAQDDAWDWRVSIAEISKAGPFSTFVGTDRVLTVIDGELLLLNVNGAEQPLEKHRPFRFSGDAPSSATLPTGNVQALNVLTRKGSFKGYTSIIELSKKRAHPVFGGQLGVLLQGQANVSPGGTASSDTGPDGGEEPLGRYDAVVGSDVETPEILGRGFLAVVSIDRVDPAASAG